MPRVRRPLIALVVLVAAVLIGYAVRAARSNDHPAPSPTDSSTSSTSSTSSAPLSMR